MGVAKDWDLLEDEGEKESLAKHRLGQSKPTEGPVGKHRPLIRVKSGDGNSIGRRAVLRPERGGIGRGRGPRRAAAGTLRSTDTATVTRIFEVKASRKYYAVWGNMVEISTRQMRVSSEGAFFAN